MTIRSTLALASLATVCALAAAAVAAPADYTFEPVKAEVKHAPTAELAVRLVHKPTGKRVEGAVMFRSRLDMSPDNMAEHQTSIEPLPSTEPGVYRFKADLSMVGRWALKLMAKVPGETETVQGTVVIEAKD